MVRAWLGHIAAGGLIGAMLAAVVPIGLRAQGADDIAALNKQVEQLYGQGKYAKAAALAQQAMAKAERVLGPEHPDTLRSVDNLAKLYEDQRRYGEAEPLYRRALAASERVLAPSTPRRF